jgi:hypothetical protein
MYSLFCELWMDERGSLLVSEWVFVATILVLGILPLAVSVRGRIHQPLMERAASNEVSGTSSYGIETGN